jgi:hypothetical protein
MLPTLMQLHRWAGLPFGKEVGRYLKSRKQFLEGPRFVEFLSSLQPICRLISRTVLRKCGDIVEGRFFSG